MQGGHIPDLSAIPLIADLPKPARTWLQARLLQVRFAAGDLIIAAGKHGQFFAVVGAGIVGLESSQGLRMINAGGSFGAEMVQHNHPAAESASALTPVWLWVITRADWLAAQALPAAPPVPAATEPAPVLTPTTPARRARRLWAVFALSALLLAALILGPPLLPRANHALTGLALQAGRPDLAAAYLRQSAAWQPDPAPLYAGLGELLLAQGDPAAALQAYQTAVMLDPNNAQAHNDLGVLLLERGELESARLHLRAAVELNPTSAALYANLGAAELAAGDRTAAAAALRRAFDLDPAQVDAQAIWAGLALESGSSEAARAAWQAVLARQPDHALASHGLIALAALTQAAPDESALAAVRRAGTGDLFTRYYLALALMQQARPAEAAAEFAVVLQESRNPQLTAASAVYLYNLLSNKEAPILP